MKSSECSLLLALPLTESQYDRAIGRDSDFLRTNRYGAADWSRYEQIAKSIRSVCKECADLEVGVVYDARSEDLTEATRTQQVVAVVAHMRYDLLRAENVIDAGGFQDRVDSGMEPEFQFVRTLFHNRPSFESRLAVVNWLIKKTLYDFSVPEESSWPEAERLLRQAPETLSMLRFDLLRFESLFGPAIVRPAKVVELSSGMVTGPDFETAIHASFRGFLDLSLCHSMPLGSLIGHRRPGLKGHIGVGKKTAFAEGAVVMFLLTMMLLNQRGSDGLSYYEAKTKMIKAAK